MQFLSKKGKKTEVTDLLNQSKFETVPHMLCKDKVRACIPPYLSLSACFPSVVQGVRDQMRDGERMEEEEYEEEKGDVSRLRAEEERQQVVVRCSSDSRFP